MACKIQQLRHLVSPPGAANENLCRVCLCSDRMLLQMRREVEAHTLAATQLTAPEAQQMESKSLV
jgi:hypothetical protein